VSALDDPALNRLWDAVAERLQRNGLEVRGVITLTGLDRSERFALAGLVGRQIPGDRVRVDLYALDARVRGTCTAAGLVAAVAARRGPLIDRPGVRATAAAQRSSVWEAARCELDVCGLRAAPWVEDWLDSVRAVIHRLPASQGADALVTAVRCLSRLPRGDARYGRTELANRVAGNSHALDDGTIVATLVLRAIGLMLEVPPPQSAIQRRALWERAGVLADEISTTVVTLGLLPVGTSAAAKGVRIRSEAGCEVHLTLRDLRRFDRCVRAGTVVWICENPRVLEAAMDAGTSATVVCISGNPIVVVTTLLEQLAADGARLRYRGDFDWPGLAIANRIISTHGAEPWRMRTGDYEEALAAAGEGVVQLPALEGPPVPAVWDGDLTPAMERAGRAIHEEALLEVLVADLAV
jgi:uncharacterized protein (TIGR02679 family)